MVPSTVVMPRVGSIALALPGRTRKVQELPFAVCAGRKSFALKRIFGAVLVIAAELLIGILAGPPIIATRVNRSRLPRGAGGAVDEPVAQGRGAGLPGHAHPAGSAAPGAGLFAAANAERDPGRNPGIWSLGRQTRLRQAHILGLVSEGAPST